MTATPPHKERPLVVVCLRVTDLRPEVDRLTGAIRRSQWGMGLSAPEGAALEHALRLGDSWSARVVAVAAGPSSIDPVLREVAALGATVVRAAPPAASSGADAGQGVAAELGADEHELAETLIAAVAPFGAPAVVLCGDRSVDRGTGALPAYLAHELGAAQALGLVTLEAAEDSPEPLLVGERRLDGGWREQLVIPLPAVCSVEGAGVRPRRAPLEAALVAQSADVAVAPAHTGRPGRSRAPVGLGAPSPYRPRPRVVPAPAGDDARARVVALTGALVERDPPTVLGPLDAATAADELIAFLVRHGYLDSAPPRTGGTGTGMEPG